MRESLMRASGRTSYCVTTGPVFVATTVAGIWKERSFSSMMRTLRTWSWRAGVGRLAGAVEQRHAGQPPVPLEEAPPRDLGSAGVVAGRR